MKMNQSSPSTVLGPFGADLYTAMEHHCHRVSGVGGARGAIAAPPATNIRVSCIVCMCIYMIFIFAAAPKYRHLPLPLSN